MKKCILFLLFILGVSSYAQIPIEILSSPKSDVDNTTAEVVSLYSVGDTITFVQVDIMSKEYKKSFIPRISLTSKLVAGKDSLSMRNIIALKQGTLEPTDDELLGLHYWKDFKEINSSVSYTLSNLGIGTYCSQYDLDFTNVSGIKAYIACGFNPTTGIVFIMHVGEVPANTGILIKGTPGTYSVPLKNTNMYYSNMFKGTLTAMTVPATEDGMKNYVLLGSDLLFHGSLGGSTLTANRAYLQIPLSVVEGPANTRGFVTLEENSTTGIVYSKTMEAVDDGKTYNLNGQQVTIPQKGLYIRNGKKVIIH